MAITDVTSLWKMAATMMGERADDVISSATTPARALDFTFDSFYDNVRLEMLRQAQPLFARRRMDLRAAPTKNAAGVDQNWSDRWRYIYQEPLDSIEFLGFKNDYPDLGLVTDFIKRQLPVEYVAIPSTGGTPPQYTWSAGDFGGDIYRNTVWIQLTDDTFTLRELRDVPYSDEDVAPYHTFTLQDLDGNSPVPAATFSYNDGTDGNNQVTLTLIDGWVLASPPSTITFNCGIYPTSQDNWTDHIFCNRPNAVGEYLYDVTDPSQWTEEFQTAVAFDLASKAAVVHAKSSKVINKLEARAAQSRSIAITQDASEDDNLEDKRISSAERARM